MVSSLSALGGDETFNAVWEGADPGWLFDVRSDLYGEFQVIAGRMKVTIDTATEEPFSEYGYCVDLANPIKMGEWSIACMSLFDTLPSDQWCQISSLMGVPQLPGGVSYEQSGKKAAAVQVAIWKVLDGSLVALDAGIENMVRCPQ